MRSKKSKKSKKSKNVEEECRGRTRMNQEDQREGKEDETKS